MSKRLSKYIACFDYFGKSLIVSSVTTGRISIASFRTVIGAPAERISVFFSPPLSISTVYLNKQLKTTQNKKGKDNDLLC